MRLAVGLERRLCGQVEVVPVEPPALVRDGVQRHLLPAEPRADGELIFQPLRMPCVLQRRRRHTDQSVEPALPCQQDFTHGINPRGRDEEPRRQERAGCQLAEIPAQGGSIRQSAREESGTRARAGGVTRVDGERRHDVLEAGRAQHAVQVQAGMHVCGAEILGAPSLDDRFERLLVIVEPLHRRRSARGPCLVAIDVRDVRLEPRHGGRACVLACELTKLPLPRQEPQRVVHARLQTVGQILTPNGWLQSAPRRNGRHVRTS